MPGVRAVYRQVSHIVMGPTEQHPCAQKLQPLPKKKLLSGVAANIARTHLFVTERIRNYNYYAKRAH
jgi:hypothetical protein